MLHTAQTEFKADIFGLGRIVHQRDAALWEKLKGGLGQHLSHAAGYDRLHRRHHEHRCQCRPGEKAIYLILLTGGFVVLALHELGFAVPSPAEPIKAAVHALTGL